MNFTLRIKNEQQDTLLELKAKNPYWLLERFADFVRNAEKDTFIKADIVDEDGDYVFTSSYLKEDYAKYSN